MLLRIYFSLIIIQLLFNENVEQLIVDDCVEIFREAIIKLGINIGMNINIGYVHGEESGGGE